MSETSQNLSNCLKTIHGGKKSINLWPFVIELPLLSRALTFKMCALQLGFTSISDSVMLHPRLGHSRGNTIFFTINGEHLHMKVPNEQDFYLITKCNSLRLLPKPRQQVTPELHRSFKVCKSALRPQAICGKQGSTLVLSLQMFLF